MTDILISNKSVINAVSGVIYEMHPYHNPENINVIIDKIQDYFKEKDNNRNDTLHLLRFESYESFEKWLTDFLMNIKEFTDYNISKKLKDAGVENYNDERNSGVAITDEYSKETEDSRYSDFIDLRACIRNIYIQIIAMYELGEDCFLCKYAKEYGSMEPGDERCKTCSCNRNITFKREPHPMSIKPKKDWTDEEKEKYSLE